MSNIRSSDDNAARFERAGQESTVAVSQKMRWAGWIMSGLAVLFLLLDSVLKVLNLPPAVEATVQLGYPASLVVSIGIVELLCILVYVFPRSAVLGAILLTGYLGGAIATHMRIGSGLFSVAFPIMLGALLWGGLFLREARLRALLPLRTSSVQ